MEVSSFFYITAIQILEDKYKVFTDSSLLQAKYAQFFQQILMWHEPKDSYSPICILLDSWTSSSLNHGTYNWTHFFIETKADYSGTIISFISGSCVLF